MSIFTRLVTPAGPIWRFTEVTERDFSVNISKPFENNVSYRKVIQYRVHLTMGVSPELKDEILACESNENELWNGLLDKTYLGLIDNAVSVVRKWEYMPVVRREVRVANVKNPETWKKKQAEVMAMITGAADPNGSVMRGLIGRFVEEFNKGVQDYIGKANRDTLEKLAKYLFRDAAVKVVDGYPVCKNALAEIEELEAQLASCEQQIAAKYAFLQKLRETTLLAHMESHDWHVVMGGESMAMPHEFCDAMKGQVERNEAYKIIPNFPHATQGGKLTGGELLAF